ncbi:MAG TPA: DUF3035 domain-containing protein [Stellaceae bacterium]|nr:DUF3035 domain-containing protein [Stellaceae bacterium]
MIPLRVFTVIPGLLALSLLTACSNNWKQAVGIEPTPPDEFAVESRAPLTMPPDFNLRPPAPGATRPQEVSAASKAQGVIDNAGPGAPGQQASGTLQYKGTNLADPNAQVADQSLAAKLLQSRDTNDSAVVEKRETTVLQGVY